MKKILVLGHHINEVSGLGKVVRNLFTRIKGYEIHLIVPISKPLAPRLPEKIGNIIIYHVHSPVALKFWYEHIKPDMVYIEGAYPHVQFWDKAVPETIDQPFLIYTVTDHPPIPQGLRHIYRRADLVLVPSKYSKKVIREAGIKKVLILYHGVDRNIFRPMQVPQSEEFIWGCIAQNNIRKQLDRLLRARTLFPHGTIKMCCNPESNPIDLWSMNLLAIVKELELDDYVIWNHFSAKDIPLEEKIMPLIFNEFDAHVLPSGGESGGLTFLEAAACGIPNITTDAGVARELLGKSALYIKVADILWTKWGKLYLASVEDLANKMKEFYEDDDLKIRLAKEGLEQVKNFTWDKPAAKLQKTFDIFIGSGK